MPEFSIGDRLVGDQHQPLVVAELGINHEGSLATAVTMADAAIAAGAEVIKHQTHIPHDEMSVEAKHVIPGNSTVSIYDVIARCALPEQEELALAEHVQARGVMFISTPFSVAAVDRLSQMNVPAVKIGSGECTNKVLLERVCELERPLIISTGMHDSDALEPTVKMVRSAGLPFALLHCTNLYPTPAHQIRLGGVTELQQRFPDAVIGLSDHSETIFPSIGAVALGSRILERHFTDHKNRPGPDIASSMVPSELSELILASKLVALASGGKKSRLDEEDVTAAFALGSVVAAVRLEPGMTLSREHLRVKRPAGGDFSPADFTSLIGRQVVCAVDENCQIPKSAVSEN